MTQMAFSEKTWEEYLKRNIIDYRVQFKNMSSNSSFSLKDDFAELLFWEPTQIIVLNFPEEVLLLVLHNQSFLDMEIKSHEKQSFLKFTLDELKSILENYAPPEKIEQLMEMLSNFVNLDVSNFTMAAPGGIGVIFVTERLSLNKNEVADVLMKLLKTLTVEQTKKKNIQKTVRKIRKEAEEIGTVEVRDKILNETTELESQIAELNTKVDREIGGIRMMIGDSAKFQDFKVFTTDLTDLKKSHVAQKVFEAKISELNTRMDGFKELKESYERMLSKQIEFMKQQSEVMSQQADFIKWVKYATVLLPIAVILVPVLEIVRAILHI